MCGIAGLLRFDGDPVDRAPLQSMIDAAHHRGPDGEGLFCEHGVGLAHKRLAIIDLDARGRQPMAYAGRYRITYNGEIYNYLELRAELERSGHAFATATDTEVILAAYAQWGEACLPRFNGMWAFAIYDRSKRELFLARDRFGVKPLHTMREAGSFAFASEIKQLLALRRERRVNRARVLDYLVTTYENHTDETFFEGIECLPAGSCLLLAADGRVLAQRRFYELREQPQYAAMDLDAAVDAVGGLLDDAIRLRLRADVTVGTCLSGGLDSSLISAVSSALYRQHGATDFVGIHARSIEQATDESTFAREVAQQASIRLAVVTPSAADFAATVDEVVTTQEEPFGSPSMFMGWHVFREAKRLDCRVMLNGQGGDEAFLGYERYFPLELNARDPIGFVRRLWWQSRHSKLSLAEALQYHLYFRKSFVRVARLRANRYLKSRPIADEAFAGVMASADSYATPFALQKLEIERLQLPHLLRYEDRNSMRHSIETRLPFLDYRLMEAAVSLPLAHKLHRGWTKYVLRKLAERRRLPAAVAWRRVKLGFEAPSGTWFASHDAAMRSEIEHSPLLREFVDVPAVLADFGRLGLKAKWNWFNLAVWGRVLGATA
jgi:asparagine synthase (glutamine-hydrolysing)